MSFMQSIIMIKTPYKKPPQVVLRGLLSDRQQSILPGRFQPSTFDAWELNCCVRDGNRWGLPAIVTGSLNRLFVFPPRQACVSLARHTLVCLRCARWPFLAASTKILVQPDGLFRLPCIRPENPHPSASGPSGPSKLYRRNYFQKTNLSCLTCLTRLQIKPSTD